MLNDYLFGKQLFIWLIVRVFRECSSFCVCFCPFGFEDEMLDLIVIIPLFFFFYFTSRRKANLQIVVLSPLIPCYFVFHL